LRVHFSESTPGSERLARLESLSTMKATFEGKSRIFFALDIAPDGDYEAVCDQLSAWEKDGVLEYETCEERVAGSFDDGPQPQLSDAG
jgi:hypothetical protein